MYYILKDFIKVEYKNLIFVCFKYILKYIIFFIQYVLIILLIFTQKILLSFFENFSKILKIYSIKILFFTKYVNLLKNIV